MHPFEIRAPCVPWPTCQHALWLLAQNKNEFSHRTLNVHVRPNQLISQRRAFGPCLLECGLRALNTSD